MINFDCDITTEQKREFIIYINHTEYISILFDKSIDVLRDLAQIALKIKQGSYKEEIHWIASASFIDLVFE